MAKANKSKNATEMEATDADDATKMPRKKFEKALYDLQVELTKLQAWTVAKGARVVVVFEGRDTAGKGGVISRIVQRCSPRVFKHVALPVPSDREKTQLYLQRYVRHLPAAGEIILFDRSWYNRAGVERVMGFCSDAEYERFLRLAPAFEREMIEEGIILLKYFLDVSQGEQRRRFEARITDPVKHWKLSPMDAESVRRFWAYTKAYQVMFDATDTPIAPWYLVSANDQRRARLNLISHMLGQIPYTKVKQDLPKVPRAKDKGDDVPNGLTTTHIVPHRF